MEAENHFELLLFMCQTSACAPRSTRPEARRYAAVKDANTQMKKSMWPPVDMIVNYFIIVYRLLQMHLRLLSSMFASLYFVGIPASVGSPAI